MTIYALLVFIHLLLFVFWLGTDLGVAILGEHFRRRTYTIGERLVILKLLVTTDMGPRTAWALMVPITVSMLKTGGYWDVPNWGVALAWLVGGYWLWLVWRAHGLGQDPKAGPLKTQEFWLKVLLAIFYFALGGISLAQNAPLEPNWLASKAVMFGVIFAAAIMIDVVFKPLTPALGNLIEKGSSDETEAPVLKIMNKTRVWVWVVYAMLLFTAFLGNIKPF
jgi:hypothetical protein